MERRKSQDMVFDRITWRVQMLHLHPFPGLSGHTGVASPHSLCVRPQAHQRDLTAGSAWELRPPGITHRV